MCVGQDLGDVYGVVDRGVFETGEVVGIEWLGVVIQLEIFCRTGRGFPDWRFCAG